MNIGMFSTKKGQVTIDLILAWAIGITIAALVFYGMKRLLSHQPRYI